MSKQTCHVSKLLAAEFAQTGHGYPQNVGSDFPENRFGTNEAASNSSQLPIYATIPQDLRRAVTPSYVDFGPHDFSAGRLFGRGQTHVSFTIAEESEVRDHQAAIEQQVDDTNRQHRLFGWEKPVDLKLVQRMGCYALGLARTSLDWDKYTDYPLAISQEITRIELPITNEDRNAYDELLHTDAVHPFLPVAQIFWANSRHTIVSTDRVYIGEGQESVRQPASMLIGNSELKPTNVLFVDSTITAQALRPSHLVLADAKRLPHGRPDLSAPLLRSRWLRRVLEPQTRYYYRAYIMPVLHPDEELDISATTLRQQLTTYGKAHWAEGPRII